MILNLAVQKSYETLNTLIFEEKSNFVLIHHSGRMTSALKYIRTPAKYSIS